MGFSSLATVFIPSPNYFKGRPNGITHVTIHHMAGNLTVEQCGNIFKPVARNASTNYGVQGDKVGGYVDENNGPYSDANSASNKTTVSMELANSGGNPDWPVSAMTEATAIKLIADIFRRNKLGRAVVGQTLCYHSMYYATACPGNFVRRKLQYIADEVNKLLGQAVTAPAPIAPAPPSSIPSGRKVGDTVEYDTIYASSTAITGKKPLYPKGKITRIISSALNPYLVEAWGWVNDAVIRGAAVPPAPATNKIKAGDKVVVIKPEIYGTNRTFYLYYKTYDVISLSGSRAVIGVGKAVTAAIDVANLKAA